LVRRRLALLVGCLVALTGLASLQERVEVTGRIAVPAIEGADLSQVVVWLTAAGERPGGATVNGERPGRYQILQKNKRFLPSTLVIPVGAVVDFPNADPFFHNVFSMYDGKRFDLGLYEAGSSRSVTFSRPGVCFVFCNIHPDMSAVIVVVDTPYRTMAEAGGEFTISGVTPGRYTLSVWHQRYRPTDADPMPREVTVSAQTRNLGTIRLEDSGTPIRQHKNKYGREYNPPNSTGPIYRK
jgi:plastocyanin